MSNLRSQFNTDKLTGTFGDELLAAGFIRVLQELYHQNGISRPSITQTDEGYTYAICCEPPLDLEYIEENTRPFYPAPIIQTAKNQADLPNNLPPAARIVYEDERDKRSRYFEAYKLLDKSAKRAEIIGEAHAALESLPPAPHEHWDIFRMINPAALISYNSLMEQWYAITAAGLQGLVCRLICELFSESPNNIAETREAWRKLAKTNDWKLVDATASQFYNPSQGKGINRPQPDSVGLGNLSSFWLLEWLKAIGLYEIGYTRTMQGVSDRKTYVPVYGRMDSQFAQTIYREFRHQMRYGETAVRSDILIILRYLRAFLGKSEHAQLESEEERWQRELLGEEYTPASFMRGFQVAFYKDLGNAVTTMNLSFLNLPGWVKIRHDDDVQTYQDILEEHEQIIRQFREDRGEELDLLMNYRDFIVANNLDPFFEFTTAYSSWLISQGEKPGFPPRKFTTHNLRRMLVSDQPNLSEILDSPGFINIARAIRESTVQAQYWKNQKNDKRYTVRYGLGRDLVRQSQYPQEFVAALSEFLLAYNAENAQVLERYPKERYPQYRYYRWDVQTRDIQDILVLIDKYRSSNLIAKLLVAYGYASEYRSRQEAEQIEVEVE